MLGLGYRSSCTPSFEQLEILTVPCLCIYSLALFMTCNSSYFKTNFSVQNTHTRKKNHLQTPLVKCTLTQRDIS